MFAGTYERLRRPLPALHSNEPYQYERNGKTLTGRAHAVTRSRIMGCLSPRSAGAPWALRLSLLGTALALLISVSLPEAAAPASPEELRIGLEAGGTLTWEIRVMQQLGLDRRYGLTLRQIPYATKAAAEMALRGGEAEIKVDDWLFATRARAQGVPVQAIDAFSRAVGGVVVRADGPIRSIADLHARRLGVPGLGDKTYLLLRTVAVTEFNFDPQKDSQVISASPPLLNQLLERGELDAIVQYWQFVLRLVTTARYRELVSGQVLLRQVVPGAGSLPFLVIVATNEAVRTKSDTLRAFLQALREAKRQLASRPELWDDLYREGLLSPSDRGLLPVLMGRYRSGLPGGWDQASINGLVQVTAKLLSVAGPDVLGIVRMDPHAYNMSLPPY